MVLALEPEMVVSCTRVVAMDMERSSEDPDIFWKYN